MKSARRRFPELRDARGPAKTIEGSAVVVPELRADAAGILLHEERLMRLEHRQQQQVESESAPPR